MTAATQTQDSTNDKPNKDNIDKTQHLAEAFNTILRGELSAIEAYQKAIEKFSQEKEAQILQEIMISHQLQADFLKKKVFSKNDLPVQSSGAWGIAVSAIINASQLLGAAPLIIALKEGEDFGIREYKYFLQQSDCEMNTILIFKNKVIPTLEENIKKLDQLI